MCVSVCVCFECEGVSCNVIGQRLTCTLCVATDEGLRGRNVLHSL